MKIAKPMLLVLTPVGVAFGLYEAWRLAGGLVFVLAAAIGVFGTAMATVVRTARRERAAERANLEQPSADPAERAKEADRIS
jgi:hypothetical protein